MSSYKYNKVSWLDEDSITRRKVVHRISLCQFALDMRRKKYHLLLSFIQLPESFPDLAPTLFSLQGTYSILFLIVPSVLIFSLVPSSSLLHLKSIHFYSTQHGREALFTLQFALGMQA